MRVGCNFSKKLIPYQISVNYYYSNIYWHFTGSPKDINWSLIYCPKDIKKYGSPKTDEECLIILDSIIKSKTLLAKSKETIDAHIITDPFCCVTDIPIQNLEEHTQYYGNIAIGFKHNQVHKQFNPVLYIPKNLLPVRSKKANEYIYPALGLVGGFSSIFGKGNGLIGMGSPITIDEEKVGSYIINHFKITSFSDKSGETFYREREWRKTGDFQFEYDDIAAIIVPKGSFSSVKNIIGKIGITDISILTWELLEKM